MTMKKRAKKGLKALVVDDDKSIRRFLIAALTSYGYEVWDAENAEKAIDLFFSLRPDILILDLGLPDRDGIEVIHQVRRKASTPIIILSVREEAADKISALDAGADDYLTKPFRVEELLARLRAVLRRASPWEERGTVRLADLSVDFDRRLVQVKGIEVHLTPTEYDILRLLIRNGGRVVTRQRILREIWNKDENFEGIDHLLRVTISNLRNKIETNPERPTLLITEPGVGYRLRSDL
ncbi:MAG: response regulator transcription factor [Candidatus Aminicenantes bacterium]|nr:response regulator transcription factor [Candidatus Aminicenantes bacterium]